MRDHETLRRRRLAEALAPATAGSRMMLKPIPGVALLTVLLLALSSTSASARPVHAGPAAVKHGLDTRPVRFWSIQKFLKGLGAVKAAAGTQQRGTLKKTVNLGPAGAFVLEPLLAPVQAVANVFSSADGSDYHVLAQTPGFPLEVPLRATEGGITHLDEYQAYEKRAGEASLRISISRLVLDAIDSNGPPDAAECPVAQDCIPIQTTVKFHARAYAASAKGDFFAAGGAAWVEGSSLDFTPHASTSADSRTPVWNDLSLTGAVVFNRGEPEHAEYHLRRPTTLRVPLSKVHDGELFAVHVSLDASAIDDRGGESAAEAFIKDPQHADPPLLKSHGLRLLGRPKFKEPAPTAPPAARCSGRPSPKAGAIQLGRPSYSTGEGHRTALVLVTRTGGSRGAASVNVRTTGGSARPGSDFKLTNTRVRFGNRDASPRLVEIPIVEDQAVESPEKFTVSLAGVRCANLGTPHSATVTILDDDQPPPPPPPEFTIGGTVDGLQGSGLALSDLGAPLRISGNGSFTFPGTATTDQPYEVKVATQPSNPGQVCAVEHGKGTVSLANVTDVAVHCAAPVIPGGLDPGFGDGGRVSTPIGEVAQGEAVVIQPDGKIVTAGSAGTQLTTDFGLTRHDDAGHLDPSFGVGGIVTTDLGGTDDKAFDAALDPNGGIVAVGRTDARGVQKTDFGVVDYLPDGSPNPNFGNHGIVTTDFFGQGAQANAVAIQGDKILVAGFAHQANGVDSDFALARYNLDGSLDTNFGDNGIVATDLGTENDDATSLAIQPDGKIVLAGDAGDNIALARYKADGSLDLTFNNSGKTVGFFGVANGVTVTPGGTILIAGEEVGASQTQDFMLASYGPNGTLNKGFGNFGAVTTDLSDGPDYAQDLAIAPDGRIFVVGQATSSTVTDMALVAYNPDGTVNDSFIADFHGLGDFGQDLAFDSQGRLVVAGSTENGGNTEFALMRVFPYT